MITSHILLLYSPNPLTDFGAKVLSERNKKILKTNSLTFYMGKNCVEISEVKLDNSHSQLRFSQTFFPLIYAHRHSIILERCCDVIASMNVDTMTLRRYWKTAW